MKYYYRIYGLNIRSEVKLEEAYEIEEQSYTVDIRYGAVPKHILEYRYSDKARCLISTEYKWFRYDNIGEFYIEKGSLIIITSNDISDEKIIRSIILGPCFGTILYQRKILTIHGSAMVWKDKAVIISGQSGAGKSTISTALRKQGWQFLADDTVAVTYEDGYLYANPAYPLQKLCLDTAVEFGYDIEQLILINEERQKYAVNVKDVFCPSCKEIKAIICLEFNNMDLLNIEEVKGNAKLEYIIQNLYSYYDFKYMGMSPFDLKQCMEVTRKIPILKVKRPINLRTENQIIDHIRRYMDNMYIADIR
jgi:hypothetical protein